ncbi:helix-turn-helix transcriptional regulator [Streptomyces sp. SNU607]|uniref:helix-turn-helix domain-containing protein n=2 Tax=Streptomyces TaxID=1883 RepID=UPI0034A371C7|nr:helix-turn-helix transcriptional regulator [Streptomyces sp. SNU607]
MPSLGSIKRSCVGEATEEVKAFALAFQEVLPQVLLGATMAEKARALGVSPSSLSHWLHGRRLPRPGVLAALRRLAHPAQIAGTARLDEDFARAERLLRVARNASCRHCANACSCGDEGPQGDRRNGVGGQAADRDRRNGLVADEVDDCTPVALAALPLAARSALLWNLGATLHESKCGSLASALGRNRMNPEMEVLLRSAESAGRDTVKIALAALGCD